MRQATNMCHDYVFRYCVGISYPKRRRHEFDRFLQTNRFTYVFGLKLLNLDYNILI